MDGHRPRCARSRRVWPGSERRPPRPGWAWRWRPCSLLVIVLPNLVGTGTALKAGAVLVFATIGISLVVLSGWAGQVSLGQMTFVGAGGAVAAWGTVDRGLDPLISLLAAGVVGAVVAVVVGLPALRLRGMYLAVTTLALSLGGVGRRVQQLLLSTGSRPARSSGPTMLGRVSLDSATRVYYLALVVLLLTIVAVRRAAPQPHRPGARRAARQRVAASPATASA